jgi:hypothetical protein
MTTYNLFISHSWTEGDRYNGLIGLLDAAPNFSYKIYRVPKNDPVHSTANLDRLYKAILDQIMPSEVIVILAGVYVPYSKWIQKEITIAQKEFLMPKPMLAIVPPGSERVSDYVTHFANKVVQWNSEAIAKAIRDLV